MAPDKKRRPGSAVFRVYRVKKVAGAEQEEEILRIEALRLDIGTRSPSTLLLDDAVAASQHCSIEWRDGGFEVLDGENASGTYLNGLRVVSDVRLSTGDVLVVGVSTLTARIDEEDGRPRLGLELKENSFFFKQKDRREFKSDPDQWVVSEWSFGRFRALAVANWMVLLPLAVLLPVAVLVPFVRLPLFDPGPLAKAHAGLFDTSIRLSGDLGFEAALAQDQSCAICHAAFGGTPMSKCGACHESLMKGQHPFHAEPFDAAESGGKVSRDYGRHDCTLCHTDHRGDTDFKPSLAETKNSCAICHTEKELSAPVDRPAAPLGEPRGVTLAYDRFPHEAHLAKKIDCEACHGDPRPAAAAEERDFGPVGISTCRGCHEKDDAKKNVAFGEKGWWAREKLYDLAWHGAKEDGGQKCLACHADLYKKELRTVASIVPADVARPRSAYALSRYAHEAEFRAHASLAGKDCKLCHALGRPGVDASAVGVFWHGLHMPSVKPGSNAEAFSSSEACAACHGEIAASKALTPGAFSKPADETCARCHHVGGKATLRPEPRPAPAVPGDARNDFPHDLHVRAFEAEGTVPSPHAKLARGCFSCHDFASPEGAARESADFAFLPGTTSEAKSCLPCHDDHGAIAGGGCSDCHPTVDGVADGVYSKRPTARDWPAANAFDHSSSGHAGKECARCHGDARSPATAKSVREVPIPDESDRACRDCHVEERARFHWR